MIVTARARTPATELQVMREVLRVLDRRAALRHPPLSLVVSDAVALGIAGIFRSATPSGQVLDRFHCGGTTDAEELMEAARFEQGFASAEGYAALRCLVLWVHSRQRQARVAVPPSR